MINIKPNIDTKSIMDLFAKSEIGDIISFADIQNVCVKTTDLNNIRSIISFTRNKLRKTGIVFHSVRNIGYKRVNASEIVEFAPNYLSRSKNNLKKAELELDSAEDVKLTNDEKIKKHTFQAATGLMLHLSKPALLGKIQQRVMNNSLSYDPQKDLKLLAGA
jgi:hypothetical protein